MSKSYRFFRFTAWAMIAVGIFSIVTGALSLMGFSEFISDEVGEQTLFSFINGGAYFMLCGAIHVAAGYLGLLRLENKILAYFCIIAGIFTLAWQLAAFIYLFTMLYISIRAALMVILPIIYLIAIISTELKVRLAPAQNADQENQAPAKKTFVVKDFFSNMNFTFRRKSFSMPTLGTKRKSAHIGGLFAFGGKRRSGRRIRTRRFKRR